MPGWQAFTLKHQNENFELISVAMDAQGPEVVRPFMETANATFTTVVDSADGLWDLYGFDLIPNGYYIDERGYVRFLKVGGFEVRDVTTIKIVEDLLAEKWGKKAVKVVEKPKLSPRQEIAGLTRQLKVPLRGIDKRFRLAELLVETGQYKKAGKEYDALLAQHPKNIKALFGRGVVYYREKKTAQALECWRKAHVLDPGNWVIRKQIWAVEHPEQFYPGIDYHWQREQIRREELQSALEEKAKAQRK